MHVSARRFLLPTLLFALSLCAQEAPPALLVKQGDAHEEMRLSSLQVDVRIYGFLAETTSTMTFANPHDRVLEGDMYFPLPEGATVNGYALDIDGTLVDGVAVEKARARAIFEKVVRQGIDPGLMEWTRGNTFKARIFPIPAKGSRTIRVRYISEIQGGAGRAAEYRLALNLKRPVPDFGLRVEVVRPEAAPRVASGAPQGFDFTPWRNSFVAETKQADAKLDEDLVIALPITERRKVMVEKAGDGGYYVCVHDFPSIPEAKRAESAPKSLVVYWDASGSRAGDHGREIALLDACLGHWSRLSDAAISLELVLLRNRPESGMNLQVQPKAWAGSKARENLLSFLKSVAYDGGTDLTALQTATAEQAMLFTDGLPTFGEALVNPGCPLHVVADAATADHVFMASLAEGSGGRYFNLKKLNDDQVLNGLRGGGWAYRGARWANGDDGLYPQRLRPVALRQTVLGKMKAGEGEIVLTYGGAGQEVQQRLAVATTDAAEGELLRRYWAQTKLNDLLAFQKQNREAIIALGKAQGLVTPFTSLLVLDSLDQYVEHRVTPPKSLPKMREQYGERMEQLAQEEKKTREAKLAVVLPMWKDFSKWWGTRFSYAKNFRFRGEKKKGLIAGAIDAVAAVAPRRALSVAPGSPTPPSVAAPESELADAFAANESNEEASSTSSDSRMQPGVVMTPWDPKTPYLAALKKASKAETYSRYLTLREAYADSPAFFLDCAGFFRDSKQDAVALQVLSNIAELELENPQLLRVLAHRLQQTNELSLAIRVFAQVLEMRPEEPQSYRDLALALIARAENAASEDQTKVDYARAIALLTEVVMRHWERFEEIEIIALVELNRIIPHARKLGITDIDLDSRLIKPIDCDMRITMTWDADNTDMDLHVVEPSGEEAYYGHSRTTIGGRVSRDFTAGYGPEEYMLRKAMTGTYKVKAKFYGSNSVKLLGGVTVQVNVITHYGRPEERRQSMTLRLTEAKEMFTIGELEF
ncbi:MAG: Ca-activated chloride channel family protein [Rhodothermales bacterium]|jgi:Ca-activated chloride channel family protein